MPQLLIHIGYFHGDVFYCGLHVFYRVWVSVVFQPPAQGVWLSLHSNRSNQENQDKNSRLFHTVYV